MLMFQKSDSCWVALIASASSLFLCGILYCACAVKSNTSASGETLSSVDESDDVLVVVSKTRREQYWKNGKLKARWDGRVEGTEWIRDGKATYWHANGFLMMEGHFDNGEESGKWTFWNEAGLKVMEEDYQHGAPEYRTYFRDDGTKEEEGPIENGRKNGIWREWSEDGSLRKESEFVDGHLVR